jgi:tRNA1(Val) A37 N6-methylase TrmN6
MSIDKQAVTDDAILNGRLRLLQPKRGHRFGHDAVLLAASVAARAGDHAVEFGSGVGTASLALLTRVPGVTVTMVEIDPFLADLAAQNIARNGFSASARMIVVDAGAPAEFSAHGLAAGSADHVFMNPPFNDETRPSPDAMKRSAHVAPRGLLTVWIAAATQLLRAGGTLTGIWRAEARTDVLNALAADFGSILVLPVHGKDGEPAIRVVVSAIKGAGAWLTELAPLVLNDKASHPTPDAEAVMRNLVPLPPAINRRGGGST